MNDLHVLLEGVLVYDENHLEEKHQVKLDEYSNSNHDHFPIFFVE